MNGREDRLDLYLEGRADLSDLPEDVRAQEEALIGAFASLREDVRADASLRGRVMAEVRAAPAPPWRSAFDWVLRPRTIRLSPATGGLALAAAAAALVLLADLVPGSGDPAGSAQAAGHVTRFVFVAPRAESVHVTGDFVAWNPDGIALEDDRGTGVWTVDVPLEPGVYQYAFIVDGREWAPDPRAMSQVDDGFGRENSVVIVSADSET